MQQVVEGDHKTQSEIKSSIQKRDRKKCLPGEPKNSFMKIWTENLSLESTWNDDSGLVRRICKKAERGKPPYKQP